MTRKLRVLVADDHFVVRNGLKSLIDLEPDMDVVAEAKDCREALVMFEQRRPDIAVLDLRMPQGDGEQVIAEIMRRWPDSKVLIFSAFSGDEDIHGALEAGAMGYVLKSSAGDQLIPALRAVALGKRWIPRDVSSRLSIRKSFESLTHREIEVLRQIAKGLANKEISEVLGISEHTTKDHVKNILGKLQVAARTEAVTVAIQRGILKL